MSEYKPVPREASASKKVLFLLPRWSSVSQSSYRLRNSEDSTDIGGFDIFHRFASEFSNILAKSTDCL